jgi:hypothetical protein
LSDPVEYVDACEERRGNSIEWVLVTVSDVVEDGHSGSKGRVLGISLREGLDGSVLFFLLGDPLFACLAAKKERIEDAAALEVAVPVMGC